MAVRRRRTQKKARSNRRDPLARERALEAIHYMRAEGNSLTRAARRSHTTPETIRRYAKSALRRNRKGRYVVTPSDRITRRVWFLTPKGKIELSVQSSRAASRIARHMNAVEHFFLTGDSGPLDLFRGHFIRTRNRTHFFLTDTEVLEQLANADEISFDDLYARRA